MVVIETEHLFLRDLIPSDIPVQKRWWLEDTEWMLWDAPWESEGETAEELEEDWKNRLVYLEQQLKKNEARSENELRLGFQIEEKATGKYLGWTNVYHIDEAYHDSDKGGLLTIGINLPEVPVRGRGYGTEAFAAALAYYKAHGYEKVYTQTWSGNVRMTRVAEKTGFRLVCRKENIRTVRGALYDGLTFEA